jgi:K+-transporting ATPase ATPase C chain
MSSEVIALARQTYAGFRVLLALTLLVGLGYPLVVLGVGQVALGWRANGSLVNASGQHQRSVHGDTAGSALIGQRFTGDRWFRSRPSVAGRGYDTLASAGSNLGPGNPALLAAVRARREEVARREGVGVGAVPPDAVTSSASGLDPDVSPAYADLQVARVARTRGLQPSLVRRLVAEQTSGRTWGVLGEPRVDVLELNIALARTDG